MQLQSKGQCQWKLSAFGHLCAGSSWFSVRWKKIRACHGWQARNAGRWVKGGGAPPGAVRLLGAVRPAPGRCGLPGKLDFLFRFWWSYWSKRGRWLPCWSRGFLSKLFVKILIFYSQCTEFIFFGIWDVYMIWIFKIWQPPSHFKCLTIF